MVFNTAAEKYFAAVNLEDGTVKPTVQTIKACGGWPIENCLPSPPAVDIKVFTDATSNHCESTELAWLDWLHWHPNP